MRTDLEIETQGNTYDRERRRMSFATMEDNMLRNTSGCCVSIAAKTISAKHLIIEKFHVDRVIAFGSSHAFHTPSISVHVFTGSCNLRDIHSGTAAVGPSPLGSVLVRPWSRLLTATAATKAARLRTSNPRTTVFQVKPNGKDAGPKG